MPNNLTKLTAAKERAATAVATLEARRAARQDEHATLGDEIAALEIRRADADAAGEPVTALEAERERLLQRQRDLAAVLPLLEQRLAEARAELHAVRLQLGGAQLAADERAVVADGLALAEEFRGEVLAVFGSRGAEWLGRVARLTRDEQEVDRLQGRRVRAETAQERVLRDTGRLLYQQLVAIGEWAAGRPIQMERPRPQEPQRSETDLDRRLRMQSPAAEALRRLGLSR